MKKILSIILVGIMLISSVFAASAVSMSEGSLALREQFRQGVGPEVNGISIDYRYFSPVSDSTDVKYPLVIWLHGMSEGSYEGKQIEKNNIAYWTSEEFQSRFTNGGAFILAARSLENMGYYWDEELIEPLRAAIDDFIAQNSDLVDVSRIYIGGFSMGGKMTLKMAVAYPEIFAAAFPICPAWQPTLEQTALLSELPVWLISGKRDPLVNYKLSVLPTWNKLVETRTDRSSLRLSTLSTTTNPDGSRTLSGHHSWFAVTYDMFSVENGDYPKLSTIDGEGNAVTLCYPDGMISWLCSHTSSYDGSPNEGGTGNIEIGSGNSGSVLDNILNMIKNLFDKLFSMLKSLFNSR